MPICLNVDLGARRYPIHIGEGLLERFGDLVSESAGTLSGRQVFIITDENVSGLYARPLVPLLTRSGAGFCDLLTLPAGEKTKSFACLEKVCSWLLDRRIDRKALIVAVGGGVIGDLAGFSASVILRGVPFVQVPTTLLAMVDSAVGGKTGISLPQGKNMVGTFHQPMAVIADTRTLGSLPLREIRAGYAECVKHAALADASLFAWLCRERPIAHGNDPAKINDLVARNCTIKAEIVSADEREQNDRRALLNFGHTFAHALESAAGYDGRLLHGEAVAIGMVLACDLSVRMGLCPAEDANALRTHLRDSSLPTTLSDIAPLLKNETPDSLYAHMCGDKKASGGKPAFVLLRKLGDSFVCRNTDPALVHAVLADSACACTPSKVMKQE